MDNIAKTKRKEVKKAWIKPELEILDIKNTKYWEFQMSEDGFWKSVWVDDLNLFS